MQNKKDITGSFNSQVKICHITQILINLDTNNLKITRYYFSGS